MGTIELSVIIPTFNRLSVLKETLHRLGMQTYPRNKYEVIVVDDCSSDGTADFLSYIELPFTFRYLLNKKNLGRAQTRNIGIKAARGEYVLMIDDDIWASPHLLEKHMEFHSLNINEIAVVGAILVAPEILQTTVNDFLNNRHVWCYEEMKGYEGALPYSFCKTASLSVKTELLKRIGLFNEKFRFYGGEDTELGYRLMTNRINLYFASEAVGYHYHDETLAGMIEKEIEKGKSMKTYLDLVPEPVSAGHGFFSPFYHRGLIFRSVVYNFFKVVLFSRLFRAITTNLARLCSENKILKPFMLRYMLPLLRCQYFRYGFMRAK